jgi:hypothetical protein
MPSNTRQLKRYNLNLPAEVAAIVEKAADERGSSAQEMMRRFILLGLTALELEKNPDDALIIRRNGVDRHVTLY